MATVPGPNPDNPFPRPGGAPAAEPAEPYQEPAGEPDQPRRAAPGPDSRPAWEDAPEPWSPERESVETDVPAGVP